MGSLCHNGYGTTITRELKMSNFMNNKSGEELIIAKERVGHMDVYIYTTSHGRTLSADEAKMLMLEQLYSKMFNVQL